MESLCIGHHIKLQLNSISFLSYLKIYYKAFLNFLVKFLNFDFLCFD